MFAKVISSLVYTGSLGFRLAVLDRLTGVLYCNAYLWHHLPIPTQHFIMLHEQGHLVLNTENEKAADHYAYTRFLALGYNHSQAIAALKSVVGWQLNASIQQRIADLQKLKKH